MVNAPISKGQNIFLQLPDETEQRILHPTKVTGLQESGVTAFVEDQAITVEAGTEAFIYFERKREFMQQSIRIEAIMEAEDEESPSIFAFQGTAEPVSAESRQCYRVSLVLADYISDFGDKKRCKVTDVSATGFSCITTESFKMGAVVPATLYLQGQSFEGKTCVQSIKQLDDGTFRYGLHVVKGRDGGTLPNGVQKISMVAQREQLKRLSGTG